MSIEDARFFAVTLVAVLFGVLIYQFGKGFIRGVMREWRNH